MKKISEKNINLICIAVLTLLPVIGILVNKLINPLPASLLTSEWNDELFYFKQVEAVIDYGYPLGYYGFNESHALAYSFAAWSPVLIWPWVLLGKIFGWTLTSVFTYNLIIYMLALFVFGISAKPDIKQTAVLSVWFFSFFLNVRYIYSSMPEVTCFAHLIIFWGCMLGYFRTNKKRFVITSIVMGSLMTFMRPYLILFLAFALVSFVICEGKAKRKITIPVSAFIFCITAFIWYLLNHFLSAEYLMPFFYTDFITTFFTDGFGPGVKNFFGTLFYKGRDFLIYMKDAFYIDRAAGVFFWFFVIMMILEAVQVVFERKRVSSEKDDQTGALWSRIYMLFSCIAFFFALLLMYKLTEGSKHLLTFICAGVMLMIMEKKKGWIYGLIMSAVVIYFGIFHCAGNAYDFEIPRYSEEAQARYEYFKDEFSKGIILDASDTPSYKNAIIWEFADNVDGTSVTSDWQMLYAVPSGTGISCCWEYTDDNFDNINCRYLSMPSGGDIEKLCVDAGYTLIARDDRFAVYARY